MPLVIVTIAVVWLTDKLAIALGYAARMLVAAFTLVLLNAFTGRRYSIQRGKRHAWSKTSAKRQPWGFYVVPSAAEALERAGVSVRASGKTTKTTKEPPREIGRNERDLAVTLKQLGWTKTQAEQRAQQVVQEHGEDAPLNDLIKYALKGMDRPH